MHSVGEGLYSARMQPGVETTEEEACMTFVSGYTATDDQQ